MTKNGLVSLTLCDVLFFQTSYLFLLVETLEAAFPCIGA